MGRCPLQQHVVGSLYGGRDPYAGFPSNLYARDATGWNSEHRYLREAVSAYRNALVVEVGVWKGASTLFMARSIRELNTGGIVIAVDTWLGSWDHWVQPGLQAELCLTNGYPALFHKFMANVIAEGLQDIVVPLPLDSGNAAQVVGQRGLRPSVIHLDAAHDFAAVTADLKAWWPLLDDDGIMLVDDYIPDGSVWPEVKRAVDAFFKHTANRGFEAAEVKARIRK